MFSEAPTVSKQADQEVNLVMQANDEFEKANYEKCLESLDQLELTGCNISSGKLRQNRAVVQFYKSGCREHAALLKALNELDVDDTEKSDALLISNCAHPTAKYNKAVIYFHRHMYSTAIETLAPLVQKLKSLEERIAGLVGVLMLQLLITTNQPNKAFSFLEYLQSHPSFQAEALTRLDNDTKQCNVAAQSYGRTFKLISQLTNIITDNPAVLPEDGLPGFAALRAYQYYLKKDFQMAAKQLMKINATNTIEGSCTDNLNTCIANNMGIIHLRVRHYAIAAKFFQSAINFDKEKTANIRTDSLYEIGTARSCEILYNLGISMLYLRRPKEAFQCFLVPLKSYHNNPRLWVRMAEACIMEYEMKIAEEEKKFPRTAAANRRYSTAKMYSASIQSAAMPEPTMEFAALSLRNALTLTLFYKGQFHTPDDEGASSGSIGTEGEAKTWHKDTNDYNFCNPSQPICKDSLDNMLSAIYAAYSYVSLRLGDYVMALEMSQSLLQVEKLSDAHKLLAHMYAGEAFMMMDKVSDAVPHLDPTFVGTLNAFDFETKDWEVKSLDAAQSIVRYNLAVALSIQGDFERARNLIANCTHPIVAARVSSLKLYMGMRANQGS